MSEQSLPTQIAADAHSGRPAYTEATLTETAPTAITPPAGTEIALKVLESTLIGDDVPPRPTTSSTGSSRRPTTSTPRPPTCSTCSPPW